MELKLFFKINKSLTLVSFEFSISCFSNKINIYERQKKLLVAMKLVDNNTVMISNYGGIYEHPIEFLSGQIYVKVFPSENHLYRNIEKIRVLPSRIFH